MTLGIATGICIHKPELAPVKTDDTFSSPVPIIPFSADQDRLQHTTSPVINKQPNQTIASQLIQKFAGNSKLAALIEKAEQAAKSQASIIETEHRRSTNSPPRKEKSARQSVIVPASIQAAPIEWSSADVCSSDEEFISRTLGVDYHQPDMKRMFYANGGIRYLELGLLYAPAFDMMRRDKGTAIRIKQGKLKIDVNEPAYSRVGRVPNNSKVFVAGIPTVDLLVARYEAENDGGKREAVEQWMSESYSPPLPASPPIEDEMDDGYEMAAE